LRNLNQVENADNAFASSLKSHSAVSAGMQYQKAKWPFRFGRSSLTNIRNQCDNKFVFGQIPVAEILINP
jgi:hypothetical protein